MLNEYLNIYLLSKKIGYVIVSRKVLQKPLVAHQKTEYMSEEIAVGYKEATILLQGKPSLDGYLDLMVICSRNKYFMNISHE
jgi:hypothetical protein